MQGKTTGWNDTIVALATAPGVSAIGVIRLSGSNAIPIADKLFPSKNLTKQISHTLHVGYLKDEEKVLDEVVISVFKNPASYTGEDVIEISCHGSPFVQKQIIDACIRQGARLAKPGEFTQRAFLNGKLDLARAEAVADLIASNTEASHRSALQHMRGGFSERLKGLREELIRFSALIELELDFSQEDVEFADRKQLYELIFQLTEVTANLVDSFKMGNVIKNGVNAAIVGKPNAGKSTLLNALLNENRAIVSDIPGTTRDTIEEVLNIDGILFRLIDTAGIRKHTSDLIESFGVERSLEKIRLADLVIYLFDAHESTVDDLLQQVTEFEAEKITYILVANKVDTASEAVIRQRFKHISHVIYISAKEHMHLEVLKEKMVDKILEGKWETESTVITNARHYHALKEVEKSLTEIKNGMDANLSGDLLALDIRRCLHYLGEITGEVTHEDQLDYIFSKFCIGK